MSVCEKSFLMVNENFSGRYFHGRPLRSMRQLVQLDDHLEVCLPSIWTFKSVGHTKFDMFFHENENDSIQSEEEIAKFLVKISRERMIKVKMPLF